MAMETLEVLNRDEHQRKKDRPASLHDGIAPVGIGIGVAGASGLGGIPAMTV